MKKILVISGKGGTGKTVITASFAAIAKKKIMVDCDVDAANLYLLLKPRIRKTEVFMGSNEAEIDREKCIRCGKCVSICRLEAIKVVAGNGDGKIEKVFIDPMLCEGCGACVYGCPVDAITLEEKESGKWFISDTDYGPFVFAKLGIAAENSGKLVTRIKDEADILGRKEKADYMIVDGPPGIGCPVISSLSGMELALIVTEPTLSGMSDMERVIKVAEYFGVETRVLINKYDINTENSMKIEKMCGEKGIPVAGRIPFSEKVPMSVVEGVPYVKFSDDSISKKIREIWKGISEGG